MTTSPQMHPSRRTALKAISATTALAATGPLPSIIFAAPSASASDKLRVGLIGAGNRAKWLTPHVANWLDCIETRDEPNAPVEVGHLITSVAHLINICRITGRTINWDAIKEQIIGDDAANALLTKERRPEFSLPNV